MCADFMGHLGDLTSAIMIMIMIMIMLMIMLLYKDSMRLLYKASVYGFYKRLLWVQSHDPRQGSLQMASLTAPKPRSSTGVAPNGLPDGSKATILDRGRSKWHSGWPQSHDPRQGSLQMASLTAPKPRSSTGVAPNGLPDGSEATNFDRGRSKWLPGWLQSHDPRQSLQMASLTAPKPRSSTGVAPNGLPDGSKATILDRGHSKWHSGWPQSHDPRQGPLKMALRMAPKPRSSTGATPNGSPDGSNATILDRGHSKWHSGWPQSHDPRQGPFKMALRMAPKPRSSTGAIQNGPPDGPKATILDRGHSK